MRLTAIRSVSTFSVGLALVGGAGQGATRLPSAFVPPPTLCLPVPKLRATPLPGLVIPRAPSLRAPGDIMPHAYTIYGLRTGPGGMACTDRNGAVIPMPFHPQIILKPFNGMPGVTPPTSTTPRLYTYNDSPPARKK